MFKSFRSKSARDYNERGNRCREKGNWQAALEYYEQAATLDPKWSAPEYNLGIVYKYQRQWAKSIEHNQRAVVLNAKDEAAWWNLGIAATAVGDWELARAAWKGFGVDIPAGSGPIEMAAGMAPIRLNPDGAHPEVVWSERLCPARARILSIPLPESDHRWRDIVLNDGAPVGYRKVNGRDVSVFNELVRLEESAYGTFLVEVTLSEGTKDEALEKLTQSAEQEQIGVEDWSSSIQILCKACSEGRPHKTHDREFTPPPGVRRVAIAAKSLDDAQRILDAWKLANPQIELGPIKELVKPV